MDTQLTEMHDNSEKAGAGPAGLYWLKQFKTIKEAEKDKEAPYYFVWYANNVIRGRWKLGEKAIAKNGDYSYHYATHIIKERFELGEKAIAKSRWKERYEKFLETLKT